MIKDPLLIVYVLLLIESFVLWLSGHAAFKRFFRFIPPVFWIYFLPMLAASVGWIDAGSPVYGMLSKLLLPASLFLLLIPVDIKAIMRLGPTALTLMISGSLGTMLGTVLAFAVFKNSVGGRFWSGFGALSGSWTGGSANMIAVKEAVGTPDAVFLPMVVVDTIVPYVWMGLLVALVGGQKFFDTWNSSRENILVDLKERTAAGPAASARPLKVFPVLGLVFAAVLVSLAARHLGGCLPEIRNVVSAYSWTIILVSTFGIVLSFTKVRGAERFGATKVGYIFLYLVLTSIGAQADLGQFGKAVPLILAGFMILGVQAAVLLITARFLRAPLSLVATASQANVGGVASGPIVAEIYHPGLAPVGLLMAVFGNIVGTYLGILTAHLCRLLV